METPQERQENEIQVLKSMFLGEFQDLREKDVWRVKRPPEIVITLTPQQGSSGMQDVHAQIDLHITYSEKYPEEVPEIALEKSKGLSANQISELKCQLEKRAEDLKGEVMVFELAQEVQKYLYVNNKPGFKSFYEEMMTRQKEQHQHQQLLIKLKAEKQRQAIQEEVQRKQEVLKEENRRIREQSKLLGRGQEDAAVEDKNQTQDVVHPIERNRSYLRTNSVTRKRCQSTSESSDGSVCEHRGTQILHFNNRGERHVQRGKCLGHSHRGSVVYAGVDITTGDLLAITEWTLKCRQTGKKVTFKDQNSSSSEIANYMKQISSVEQELNYLQKLCHPNLLHCINMKYVQEKENLVIYILQEFVIGTPLSYYLTENLPVDMELLRHYSLGILQALSYLHANHVVHKDLRDTSVFIDRTGVVKVSDYSLDKRLADIYQSAVQEKVDSFFPPSLGRGGKKCDIYRFGILVLSLTKGCIITDVPPDIPTSLPAELRDFLSKCLMKDEHHRLGADQLLEHPFLKTPVDRGLSPQKSLEENQKDSVEENEEERDSDIHLFLPASLKGQSRVESEFEVLKWLGKGAFGDVLKVKNKLDGRMYAIKRIPLNPKNKQLNRKITREVKLLSRLNHENVVRYYNSWIESAKIESAVDTSSVAPTPSASGNNKKPNSLVVGDDIERLAPPIKEVEWSVSYESSSAVLPESVSSDDSSDDDDDEDEVWIGFLPRSESSDGIVFEKEGSGTASDSGNLDPKNNSLALDEKDEKGTTSDDSSTTEIQFMYIQMEFCEKSTLRNAIDDGLYEDEDRVWRLFREIVEGLVHIHQQGMIHRDLKPVNVFLDSNDHVKIGDFGLATTNVLPRPNLTVAKEATTTNGDSHVVDARSYSHDVGDGSMTGQVGTALYVAPELSTSTGKAIYNQKVDVYSLGIIFFEMCYNPLQTNMERVQVLSNLRLKEIILPTDMDETIMPQQVYIVRWLLNHDPSLRPTSFELLQSDYVPPPQLEEAELQEMVRHTLSNPQSKAYKHLVATCFKQDVTPAEDITYDMNIPKGASIPKPHLLQELAKEAVIQVFQKHGATCISTPLLMPKNKLYEQTESCVKLMTHSGGIVSIPHDLRVPFARYVAWNSINYVKRYSVDRVYREKKVFGFHPRELYECAFDIVTPNPGCLIAEAELLAVVWEVVNEFPSLREKNCTIRLNHTSLLKAILLHCGIEEEKYHDIYSILSEARDERYSKFQVQTHLISLCLTEQAMMALFSLIETESPISKISSSFRIITKRKGPAATLAKQALHELEGIISNAEALGVKCPIVITPGLVYNVQQYSGMMCQFVCELKKKRRRAGLDVIAAGGRYDTMLDKFRQELEMTGMVSKEVNQSAAGISISLDKIVSALQDDGSIARQSAVDVLVCSLGHRMMIKEKAHVVRDLWAAGIKSSIIDTVQTLEDIQETCQELGVAHIVMLKDTESGTLRVRSWEGNRFQEKKMNTAELVDYMQRLLKISSDANEVPVSKSDSSKMVPSTDAAQSVATGNPFVNLNFVLIEKLALNIKRRHENQMMAHISPTLQHLSARARVEVLGLNLDMTIIKTIASHLEIDGDEQEFQKSVNPILEKHARHRKYLVRICDEIHELKFEKMCPIIILYSLIENGFKMLM